MVAGWMVARWPCPAIEVHGALSVAGGHRAPSTERADQSAVLSTARRAHRVLSGTHRPAKPRLRLEKHASGTDPSLSRELAR